MNNFQKISNHKQVLNPAGDQKVPVVFHVNDELMPDEKTVKQLKFVASDKRIFHHVSALTDVHSKPGRKNPSGTAVAVDGYVFPQTVDTAPNCGMRMIKTPFGTNDLSTEQIDDLFHELVNVVPTKAYVGNFLPRQTVVDISYKGVRALLEHFKKGPSELENTMNSGNMFNDSEISEKELFRAIPSLFFRFAQLRLGILGAAGNHFLDLLRVDEIIDEEIAKKLGVKKNQYLFLIHTGSGMFGQYCSYFYTPKIKEHASQKFVVELAKKMHFKNDVAWHQKIKKEIPEFQNRPEFYGYKEDSEEGRNFMIAHRAGANHGFANRALIQINIEKAIEKVLGKKLEMPLVYDMTHISISKENHYGKDVWIHRNNVTRAYGPELMRGTNLYEETGEPLFVPSSMSTPAFLGVALDGNESTFHSAPHGMGKAKKEQIHDEAKTKDELFEKMKNRGVRLYNARSKGVIGQDSSYYKNFQPAIEGLIENQIMKPVAKMMPVAVLMY